MALSDGSDIAFFARLARLGGMAAAAREMGLSPPAVSRRLAALEARLGVRLLNRTTRRQSLTPEGEKYLEEGLRILDDIESLERDLTAAGRTPRGVLRINAGFGFGRRHLGPAVSDFVRLYPEVEVLLHLTDRPVDLAAEAMDIGIRFGTGSAGGLMRRRIAANRRVLCAAPAYLARRPPPETPAQLRDHDCILIRENEGLFKTWHLVSARGPVSVKIGGAVSSNHGEVAVDWALAGHGILLRSEWDIAPYLRSGDLVRVLDGWEGVEADIYAVFQHRHQLSTKIKSFLDFLAERFAARRAADGAW